MKHKMYVIFLITLFFSCEKSTETLSLSSDSKDEENMTQNDSSQDAQGLIWLQSIFKCENFAGKYCYPDDEEKIFSDRFYEFLIEGWSMQTGQSSAEVKNLEKNRKEKWGEIYPDLIKEEIMPFGRGQDVISALYNLEIKSLGNLEYDVYIHYIGELATQNKVKLVPVGDSFRIDYVETQYLEKSEIKPSTYKFTQEWSWNYKNGHIEEMEIGHKGKMSLYYDPESQNWLFNSESFGGAGIMFKWLLGRPDGTYLSINLPFEGEKSSLDFWDAQITQPLPTKLNEFYTATGKTKVFNENNSNFPKLEAKEYKRVYPRTNDFNMVYLADTEANFTAVYFLNELDIETPLPFHFDIEIPVHKAVMFDKAIVAGEEVNLEFIEISSSDLEITIDWAKTKIN